MKKCTIVQAVSRLTLTSGVLAQNHLCLNGDFMVENLGMEDFFLQWLPFSLSPTLQTNISVAHYSHYVGLATDSVIT